MAGRPNLQDGYYEMGEVINEMSDDFKNEKELCDFIEANIMEFTKDCMGVEYAAHIREYALTEGKRFKGSKRIDFLIITTKNERIGVECKKPMYGCELSSCIGQALTYLTVFEQFGRGMSHIFIVSSKIEWSLPFTIDKFNLPISFVALDKTKFLSYQNGSTNRK